MSPHGDIGVSPSCTLNNIMPTYVSYRVYDHKAILKRVLLDKKAM